MSRSIHKLNARRLVNLTEPGWYSDGGRLYLRIEKDGSKRWVFVWIRNKKRREMGLGGFRDYSLDEARAMAVAAWQLVKEGIDPIEARRAAIEEERQSALAAEQAAAEAASIIPTFWQCAEVYIAAHEDGWSNAKHRWQWTNSLTKHAKPLLQKPVNEITADDLVDTLKPIWRTIADTAGRVRARIETILDAAKSQGHIKSPWENPARWKGNLEHRLPKRVRLQTGHYPAITYEKLPAFFKDLRARSALAARALELTILCATRSNETLGARWKEFDFDTGVWTVPAERMKMKVEHRIPLSDAALEILTARLRESNGAPDDFVFPGQKRGMPRSQMSMTMVLRRMKMGHITVHGMRSTFRDYMGDMTDHAEAVVEHALAHQVGDTTVRAYRRKKAFEKRRAVMADWARYVLSASVAAGAEESDLPLAA